MIENSSTLRKFKKNLSIIGGTTTLAGSIVSGSSFSASAIKNKNLFNGVLIY